MADAEKQVEAGAVEVQEDDFASLLQKEFRPKSEQAKTAVEQAVQTLAAKALENTA
ncbi:MAG: type VI secretion system contractile sheath large subunit, partial [Pseudomonadota bacterium]